jgi:diguanylate cyclase (GGDEF)-like protein
VADAGRVRIDDEVGILVAALARVAGAARPDLGAALARLRAVPAEGGLPRDEMRRIVDELQVMTSGAAFAQAEREGAVVERLGAVICQLVPAADPAGAHRDEVVPALRGLSQSAALDEALPHLEAIEAFATRRRASATDEVRTLRECRRRAEQLEGLAASCVDFIGRAFVDLPEVGETFSTIRIQLKDSDAATIQNLRVELNGHLARFEHTGLPVHEQKTVIKDVLRALAEQLSAASAGSDEFVDRATAIRSRIEACNDLGELRTLQQALMNETAEAARSAASMKSHLTDLSHKVQSSQEQIEQLERKLSETRAAMNLDPLTRVPNRRALDQWVSSRLYDRDGRLERSYCVLVLDLDHFKHVNDTYGHLGGDRVLAEAARRLKLGIREIDFLARYGGEEFVVVLPDCDLRIGGAVADRMCRLLAAKPVHHDGHDIPVTTSIGVALVRGRELFSEVFERADQCVYVAKQSGRNQAVTEERLS